MRLRLTAVLGLFAVLVLGLTALDLAREPEFPPWGEVALDLAEKLLLLAAMAAVAWTVHGLIDLRAEQAALSERLTRAQADGEGWRAEKRSEIAAMGQAIEDQLRRWQLSAAEIDIAGLMLKGASLKEIAQARATSEATIRQQAQSIYRKSGLSGRAELSAYFLDSLFGTAEDLRQTRLRMVRLDG